jgi:1,4-dihydroxy-6-naphthoate synthase
MKLTIGFSPCPNDTFIFDALVNNKIDTEGLEFEPHLLDVEALNRLSMAGKLDISKLSYGVLPLALGSYILLDSGSALGRGVGPLFIRSRELAMDEDAIGEHTIAIPGEHTTAHLLFSLAYPKATKKVFMRYDEIEEYVLSGKGLGVIIHENRFTYQDKGLEKIADLGEYWEKITGKPIPLGGIVMKREFDSLMLGKVDRLIKRSIEFAFGAYPDLSSYVKMHAQEMSEPVMRKHIDLYVNNYSLSLGEEGRQAVKKILEVFGETHAVAVPMEAVFPGQGSGFIFSGL